jgi:uncharacterized Zn finger protein
MSWWSYRPYVSVAQRRAKAHRKLAQLAKKGHVATPVEITGRAIATTFWGQAWCDHLESYSDFANRLPRGRTYARNGSVVDLRIEPGQVVALVSGSELYEIRIRIDRLARRTWKDVQSRCAGRIGSLVELLQGKLSRDVMQVVTDRDHGLFPKPHEIDMECSCPDWAGMCKHLAATLYGVGARLDHQPELLFVLRHVDQRELIAKVGDVARLTKPVGRGKRTTIAAARLADVFGIELDDSAMRSTKAKSHRAQCAAPAKLASRKTRSRVNSTTGAASNGSDQDGEVTRKRRTAKRRASDKPAHQAVATKTRVRVAAKKKRAAVVTTSATIRRKTK